MVPVLTVQYMYVAAGAFAWAATPVNTSVSQPCPHGGSGHSHAGIYCNSDGQWTGLDVTQCQYTSDVTAKLEQYSQVCCIFRAELMQTL